MAEAGEEGRAEIRICQDLGLPLPDPFSQDWAYELPEEYRTQDWLNRYFAAYATEAYGDPERRKLLELILDIVNDNLTCNDALAGPAWERAAGLARANYSLHREQIEYWALPGHPIEDAFTLSPLAREFLASRQ